MYQIYEWFEHHWFEILEGTWLIALVIATIVLICAQFKMIITMHSVQLYIQLLYFNKLKYQVELAIFIQM